MSGVNDMSSDNMLSLNEAISKSEEIKNKVAQSVKGLEVSDDTKSLIVVAFLCIAQYHHSAIISLIKDKNPTSATALHRPLLEACYRGTWVSLIATDEDAEAINDPNYKWSSIWKLSKDIGKLLTTEHKEDTTTFYDILDRNLKSLHGYTHGGLEQLARQFTDTSVEANYTDDELRELILSADSILAMTLIAFSYNTNNKEIGELAKNILLENGDN